MMGAKNHAAILPDANKEQCLNQLAGAAFGAAGQRCMALSVVILVGEAKNWVGDIVERAKKLVVAAGKDDKDLGPVISKAAKARVERLNQARMKAHKSCSMVVVSRWKGLRTVILSDRPF